MEKKWLSSYPPGVPYEIDHGNVSTLVALCDEACAEFAGQRAFGNFGTFMTFADVERNSRAFAAFLQAQAGIQSGDRVALMMPNILQYPVSMIGALRAGAIVVNTNPQYTARELHHQLVDSGARLLVVLRNMLSVVHEALPGTDVRHIVVTELGDLFPFPKSLVFNRAARRRSRQPGEWSELTVTKFNDALKSGTKSPFSAVEISADDLAFLQYTGGTTGKSKGAMLSHRNVVANTMQVGSWLHASTTRGEEIVITALPLYHIYALTVNCFSFFREGALNYFITDPRDTKRFIKELTRVPFTAFAGVNTLFSSLLDHDDIGNVDFSRLKYSSGGGAAIQTGVANAWEERTGTIISQGYGLTEASPVVCVNPFEMTEFTGSIGVPVPSTDCRIVTDDGSEAEIGEAGELLVRGPQVMQGYWQHEDENPEVFDADGWLRTGDVAVMDEAGFFSIVDRKKDLIIVSGFNVYPNEIEDIVAAHPGIAEVAAIGVDDPRTNEAVKLVAVRRDPSLTSAQIIAHCRKQLTPYKVPRQVEFVDDLPKSNVGKILRRIVKERHGSQTVERA
ncbi:MAG: AMP-binding protein [Gammaproteobacteria bacterium]|jgi:long-chain acyl-CoA synthetase